MVAKIKVAGLFDDGNTFVIIGKCRRAGKLAGWSQQQLKDFGEECRSGDYDHALQTVMAHFDEADDDDDDEEL